MRRNIQSKFLQLCGEVSDIIMQRMPSIRAVVCPRRLPECILVLCCVCVYMEGFHGPGGAQG